MGTALLPFLLCAMAAVAADDGLPLTVHRIADREAALLRAWSAPDEGMAEVPFVYQVVQYRVLLDKSGKPIGPEVTLLMERMIAQGEFIKAANLAKELASVLHSLEIVLNIESMPILEPLSTT